jgi:hypothetical protein
MKQFEGQHEGEEILFVFRRHIIAMRKGFYLLLIPFLVMSLPALVIPLVPYDRVPEWWADPLNLLMLSMIGFGVGLILFGYQWMGWYFSVYIVTSLRLRQLNQAGFFGKSVIDLGLTKIQNISYNVEGFTAAVFGFGTIVVQTYVGDLVLDRIHNPEQVYNKLQDAVRAAQKSGAQQENEAD